MGGGTVSEVGRQAKRSTLKVGGEGGGHFLTRKTRRRRRHSRRAPGLQSKGVGWVITDAMPLVYTVRTCNQAGTYPDDPESIGRMMELLHLGLRGGMEVLDVEAAWGREAWGGLVEDAKEKYQGKTLLLGSHHVPKEIIGDDEARRWGEICQLEGEADGVKLILSVEEGGDVKQALRCAREGAGGKPTIAMALGVVGQESRVLNPTFTPVTHGALPFVAAPGQLSAEEIMERRVEGGLVGKKTYWILGRNIPYTLSPALHGLAMRTVGLPHDYEKADVGKIEDFVEGEDWKGVGFGGSSVTIPYKEEIMKYLDEVKDEAREIGAVNTVVAEYDREGGRKLVGYNTDWVGIYDPIKRRLAEGGGGEGGGLGGERSEPQASISSFSKLKRITETLFTRTHLTLTPFPSISVLPRGRSRGGSEGRRVCREEAWIQDTLLQQDAGEGSLAERELWRRGDRGRSRGH